MHRDCVKAGLGAALLFFAGLAEPARSQQAGITGQPGVEAGAGGTDADVNGGFDNPFERVEVQTLSQIGSGEVGLLTPENGGLAADAWAGTDRLVAEILMPQLPGQPGSPAVANLERVLLLSRVKPPSGATAAGASLFGARLARLVAVGQVDAVELLAQQMPGELSAPSVVGARVDALFLQARDEEACGLAATVLGRVDSADWTKRITYCDGLSGNITAARLGVDLLRESGDADEAFFALMGRLVDNLETDPVSFEAPSPVHFALLRRTGTGVPNTAIARAGGGFATGLAALETLSIEQRLLAAEAAVAAGALPPGALRRLYELAQFPKEDAEADTAPYKGPLGAARAFQLAQDTPEPAQKAVRYAAMLKDARSRGVLAPVAWALRADIAALPAEGLAEETAFELGAAEVLAGEPVGARRWLDALVAEGRAEGAAAGALRALMAARGFGAEAGWSADLQAARIERLPAGDAKDLAVLEYALLRALGAKASDRAYRASLTGPLAPFGAVPNPAILEGLIAAAGEGRSAEALLFAMIALGENAPRTAHPATLVSVLGALRQAGFETQARAIAVEALAARLP